MNFDDIKNIIDVALDSDRDIKISIFDGENINIVRQGDLTLPIVSELIKRSNLKDTIPIVSDIDMFNRADKESRFDISYFPCSAVKSIVIESIYSIDFPNLIIDSEDEDTGFVNYINPENKGIMDRYLDNKEKEKEEEEEVSFNKADRLGLKIKNYL